MFEMILLILVVLGMSFAVVYFGNKKTNWYYLVDNVSIEVCRKFNDLHTAMDMYNLCVADGHEVYIKRMRG